MQAKRVALCSCFSASGTPRGGAGAAYSGNKVQFVDEGKPFAQQRLVPGKILRHHIEPRLR